MKPGAARLYHTLMFVVLAWVSLLPSVNAGDALDHWSTLPFSQTNGGFGLPDFTGLLYANGRYIAVGQNGASDLGTLATSTDGKQWVRRTMSPAPDISMSDVKYGAGSYVAVGWGGNLVTSSDGTNWFRSTLANDFYISYSGLTYGGGLFVAVGANFSFVPNSGRTNIATSPDGLTWTKRTSSNADSLGAVAFGNGVFLAVGFQSVVRATQASPAFWGTVANTGFRDICFGNGLFVMVGNGGAIQVSTGGGIAPVTSGTTNELRAVTFGAGRFLAASITGELLVSTDGTNWINRGSVLPAGVWTLCLGENAFYAAGTSNLLAHSDPLASLAQGGPGQLRLKGLDRATYGIQARDSLQMDSPWQQIGSVMLTNQLQSWIDPNAASHQRRYYRTVLNP